MLPLGVRYLLSVVPFIALPLSVVTLLLSAWPLGLSPYASFILSLISLPLGATLLVQWNDYCDHRQAAELGAILPPCVEDGVVGGLGTMQSMLNNLRNGYLCDNMREWACKYGPVFNIRIMFENRMFTTEPEHIKNMLSTNFSSFEKGPKLRFQFDSLLGSGVFNSDGEMWKFHRNISRPFFAKDRISDLQGYARYTDRALDLLSKRLDEGFAVDLQDLASRFTLDWTTDFLLGADAGSLSEESTLPYPVSSQSTVAECNASTGATRTDNFARSFVNAQFQTSLRTRYGPAWPLFELWKDKVKEHLKPVYDFVEPIIQNAIERNQETFSSSSSKPGEETLLDHLVKQTNDRIVLRDETLNMLIAGRDTTTFLIASTMYALAENPAVLVRLRSEILEAFGANGTPTVHDLRSLKYLHAVLKESLRLWPPVPMNIRRSKKAALWAPVKPGQKPFCVPANTKCSYSVFLMHRRVDLWGDDADKYDPDRFLDERFYRYLVPNPYIFLPFNAGPRLCMGSQIAYDEASFFIIKLLQRFSEITLAEDAQPLESIPPWKDREKVWFTSHLTMYFKGGLWMRMQNA